MTTAAGTKTPAQAQKEADQKEWEAAIIRALDRITEVFPDIEDRDSTAEMYRQLNNLRSEVEQCSPAVCSVYNKAIETLFAGYDAIPGSFFIDDRKPRP